MAENYHLTYNSEKEGWDIKKEGASRPSDHFPSHAAALKRARELALNNDVNLILHDESGAIVGSESGDALDPNLLQRATDKVTGAVGAVASAIKS